MTSRPEIPPVVHMRLVVEAEDFEAALVFYRDALGLPESAAFQGEGDARVVILEAGRATLELANPAQKRMIDDVEVGRQVSPKIRVAFEVGDSTAMTLRLVGAGAALVAEPTETPWRSLNSRLDAPAGLHITLFQELAGVEGRRLPNIDGAAVAEFWDRFLAAAVVYGATPLPEIVEPFGDSAELADELIDLVVGGPKRATASALVDYESGDEKQPHSGMLSIATDGAGRPRAVLRTTEVRIGPLSSVDDAFAWDEGEGDRTRATWIADHEDFFRRYLPTIGESFDPGMQTVFERFEVLYTE